ncbi:Uncharacterized protein PBTT_08265 [Plasmodiophora brassicae]
MALYNYSSKTLMGNWREDRLAPSKVLSEIHVRPVDNDVQAGRMKRFTNPTTQGTIADYGKNDFSTTNGQSFRWPGQVNVSTEPVKMIRLKTFSPEQSTRSVKGPLIGFGAVLPRHPVGQYSRALASTAHSAFGGPHALDDHKRAVPPAMDPNVPAGVSSEQIEQKNQARQRCPIQDPNRDIPATSLPGLGQRAFQSPKAKGRSAAHA